MRLYNINSHPSAALYHSPCSHGAGDILHVLVKMYNSEAKELATFLPLSSHNSLARITLNYLCLFICLFIIFVIIFYKEPLS